MSQLISSLRPLVAMSVAIASLLVVLSACEHEPDEVAPEDKAPVVVDDQPEQKFYDYRLIETQLGVKQWILDSDEMLKFANRSDVDLINVKMDFYREGVYFSTLVSDSGTANLETHDVFVWGHVVITNTDGRRLRTSELRYTNEDGRIRNQVYNVFDEGADVITGIGLEATPDLKYIELIEESAAEIGDDAAATAESTEERP